jgi:hypothetical protein
VGPNVARWGEAALKARGIAAMRVLVGLLSLASKHTSSKIDRACELALAHGSFRLHDVKALMSSSEEQTSFDFMAEHPVIRNMNEYGSLVKVSFGEEETKIVPIAALRRRHDPGDAGDGGGFNERSRS